MAVQCLDLREKKELYIKWETGTFTKSGLADMYGISVRTLNRVLDEMEEAVLTEPTVSEDDDYVVGFVEEDFEFGTYDLEDAWTEEELEPMPWHLEPEDDDEVEYHFVATPIAMTITKVVDGRFDGQVNVDQDHPRFDEASSVVWSDRGSQESLEKAYNILDQKTFIENASLGRVTVDGEHGRVFYTDGEHEIDFHGRLVPRLLEALHSPDDGELDALLLFTDNLSYNPSNRAVNELYDFLEASDIKIDENGFVLCFKKVRENYTDIHSGKFDNSPGAHNSVPRNMVDENSDNTCSHGLHVCSKSYLPHFGSSIGNRIMQVIVDPADFVAIPKDYDRAKARVSAYTVMADITEGFYDAFEDEDEDDWLD